MEHFNFLWNKVSGELFKYDIAGQSYRISIVVNRMPVRLK